jgi:hypothetical protein
MTLRDRKSSVYVHVQVNEKINNLHFDHIIVPLEYTELHSSVGSDGIPVVLVTEDREMGC